MMPSKLKKAIGAVKDQTSISIAKVGSSGNGASNLEVVVLKATSHDETPLDERYVNEILQLVASSEAYAASCAQAISKRIGKTRSWIVVLKSLMLVLRIFQDGDPYFPREVLHTMKAGGKILNLSSFRDNSYSSPWDFTVYVRLFAVYLDDRLDCFLKGKLQKRATHPKMEKEQSVSTSMRDMKPSMLLDQISYFQRLLDRAMVTRPTGAAKDNALVQLSLYSVVQESFYLYRDISDGLTLLLDSFFNLQYQTCVSAFQTCIRTTKQYEELSSYYAFCKSLGIGKTSEYPSVQNISDELMETLREFLKDKASFATPPQSAVLPPSNPRSSNSTSTDQFESRPKPGTPEPAEKRISKKASEHTSVCSLFEDLTVTTEDETSSSFTFNVHSFEDTDRYSGEVDSNSSNNSSCSSPSMTPTTATSAQGTNQTPALATFDDWLPLDETNQDQGTDQSNGWWEFELAKTSGQAAGGIPLVTASPQTNPFLQEEATPSNQYFDFFPVEPTFQATPTFSAGSPNQNADAGHAEGDPFGSGFVQGIDERAQNGSSNQQKLMYEQQLWLQNQNKIIQRHRTC